MRHEGTRASDRIYQKEILTKAVMTIPTLIISESDFAHFLPRFLSITAYLNDSATLLY